MRSMKFTFKVFGLFLKSMSPKNISSLCHHIRDFATLNCNHSIGVPQLLALFTSDQVSLL